MFRITEDPSSENLVQCLARNYKNDSGVSADMDKVGVLVAYAEYGWILCDPKHVGAVLKYFIILIVPTCYILCISWLVKCLIIIDARCKHEDYST
jgi:hypothetical protein